MLPKELTHRQGSSTVLRALQVLLLLDLLVSLPLVLVFIILGAFADHELVIRFLLLSIHAVASKEALEVIRYVHTDALKETEWQTHVVTQVSILWIVGPLLALIFDIGSLIDFGLYFGHEIENDPHHQCGFACLVTVGGVLFCLWLALLTLGYLITMGKIYRQSRIVSRLNNAMNS